MRVAAPADPAVVPSPRPHGPALPGLKVAPVTCAGAGRTVTKGTRACPVCGKHVTLLRRMDWPYSGARVKVPRHLPASGGPQQLRSGA